MLRRTTFVLLVISFFANNRAGNAAIISSTFDTDAEGWTVSSNGTSTTPDYMASGGNTGGMIQDTDAQSGVAWFFDAPAKFLGDQSDQFNRSLSFDIRHTGSGTLFAANDIRLIGGGVTLLRDFATNPAVGDWTTYSTFLNADAPWKHSTSGLDATNSEIQTVLSSLTAIQFRGEYLAGAIGSDTGRLDNVVMGAHSAAIPEPSSWFLMTLISGGCVLVMQRQRRANRRE